jgi:ABC-type microcin C transport system duplicated ATPase subunit YejF
MPVLSIKNLTVNFYTRDGIVNAVKDISYDVNAGEVVAIVGESGSGKSVSCHALLDLIAQPPGKIESGHAHFGDIDLLNCNKRQMRSIRGNKIAMIFQDPMTSLNPYMTIGSQLIEVLTTHSDIDKKLASQKAAKVLEEVGISDGIKRLEQYPHEFSGGMRQRVMIAMALLTEPELLIADEPTTALDVTIQAQIFDLLHTLREKYNIAIIFITHDLAVVAQLADRVLVMKDGSIVEQGTTEKIFRNTEHEYTKNLLAAIPNSKKPEQYRFHGAGDNDVPILQVSHLTTRFADHSNGLFEEKRYLNAVDNVDLYLNKGEILGLVGESGCGKSTLSKTIIRLIDSHKGSVKFEGHEITSLDPKGLKHLRQDLQIIFQDPYASLNPRMSVYDILLEPLKLHQPAAKEILNQRIIELMHEVGLSPADIRKYPHEFSGGQRQRIAIARALAVAPKVIVADEPVSALDVTIQAQILDLFLQLVKRHDLSIIFVSHDLSVIRYLCDRTAVMSEGKIVEVDQTETVFNHPKNAYTQKLIAAIPSEIPNQSLA